MKNIPIRINNMTYPLDLPPATYILIKEQSVFENKESSTDCLTQRTQALMNCIIRPQVLNLIPSPSCLFRIWIGLSILEYKKIF